MSDSEDPSGDDGLEPESAFRLFGHELRVAILFELWRASAERLTYAELRSRVGERDSGKFNYHLSKLVGQFVGHDGNAYRLLYPGHRVIDAIQSGVLHERATVDPVPLEAACPSCESSLVFEYADHVGTVSCSDCDRSVLAYPFDPGGLADRSPTEVAAAFDRRTRHFWRFALSGVCPVCAGRVEATARIGEEANELDAYLNPHSAAVTVDCDRCSFFSHFPVGAVVLGHPAVLGFCYDRGVDVRSRRLWELEFVVDPARVTVRSSDPPSIAIDVGADDETLRARVDETLSVRSLERTLAD